jgi:predicted TIM-barrel fold metal-dependent hydrolase
MLSRRDLLATIGGAALHAASRSPRMILQSAAVAFDVPAGACDCHAHVFCDPARFPFASTRTYTPPPAAVEELRRLHEALHIDRVVIVHPSVYGTDNSCTLDAVRRLGSRARAVGVIDESTPDAALKEMRAAGVRGIRVNLGTAGITDPAVSRQRLELAVTRAAPLDWHVQVYTQPSVIRAVDDYVRTVPVPIVFDHFGGAQTSDGITQPGFNTLADLVRSGRAYVKISAPYRSSRQAPDYADVAPFAKALISANPDRVLWGTDWPHPDSGPVPGRKPTDTAPFYPIDDGRVLSQLAVWAPDASVRRKILVDNPARLYGF